MQIHFDTYKVSGQRTLSDGKVIDLHTVEVTINGDRRVVSCGGVYNGWISVWGLAVRFKTGTKVWPGEATYWIDSGKVNGLRPNIDKRGMVHLVGFYEDYKGKAVQSQHNAVA